MAQFEFWQKNDLKSPVQVQALHGVVFTADSLANRFGVEVTDHGAAAELSGFGAMGYAIRADGQTLAITGEISGSRASILLPAAAYTVPGTLDVVVKAVSGDTRITVGAWRCYVQRSTTDAIVDPGHVIPSLEELLAQISRMEADMAKIENMTAAASTLPSGSSATAAVGLTDGHYHIAFGIPQSPADAALTAAEIDSACV